MAITPSPFAVRKAPELDWSDYRGVWDYLSDFWDWVTTNREYPNVFWRAWNLIVTGLSVYFENHQFDFSWMSPWYWGAVTEEFPLDVILSEDNRVNDDPTHPDYHSYYIDASVRQILQLDDSLVNPSNTWTRGPSGVDYFSFESGVHDSQMGILHFWGTTYWDTDRVSYDDGTPYIQLWSRRWVRKAADTMVTRFGPFVGYGAARKTEPHTAMDIMMLWAGQIVGPIIPVLQSGLYINNDWPMAPVTGTVTAIDGTSSVTITRGTQDLKVTNDTGLTFRIQDPVAWRNLVVGDIVEIGDFLVEACWVYDIVTDPLMWTKYAIGLPETRHTFVCAFNAELPTDTSSGDYDIEWDRIVAFVNRAKPIGDKPFYIVLINAQPVVSYNDTNLKTLHQPFISLNGGGVFPLGGTVTVSDLSYCLDDLLTPSIVASIMNNTTLSIAPGLVDLSGPVGISHGYEVTPEITLVYTDLGFVI